jgi:hypothetical protein
MRIDRADSTLRRSWVNNPLAGPADTNWEDPDRDTGSIWGDGVQGLNYGALTESPENDGDRFHTPKWISDMSLFRQFGRRLLEKRTKEFPEMVEFQTSKTEIDIRILWSYFRDRCSYGEIFEKFRRNEDEAHGGLDISTNDAKNVEEAVELAAQRSGTLAFYDEETNSFTYLDQMVTPGPKAFKHVTARKVNAEIFRVKFHPDDGEAYYLPEKLDPAKNHGSTRRIQRYIEDLVSEGYVLLKMPEPNQADRKAAHQKREAEEQLQIAHAQYGSGTNPHQYSSQKEAPGQLYKLSQAQTEHIENKRTAALLRKVEAEDEAWRVAKFSPAQLKIWQRYCGETCYRDLMKLTKVDQAKDRFIQALPWQPPVDKTPVIEFKPTEAVEHKSPAVRPEFFTMTLQVLTAMLAQAQSPQTLAA